MAGIACIWRSSPPRYSCFPQEWSSRYHPLEDLLRLLEFLPCILRTSAEHCADHCYVPSRRPASPGSSPRRLVAALGKPSALNGLHQDGPQTRKKSMLECSSQGVMLIARKHRKKKDRGLKGSRIHDRAIRVPGKPGILFFFQAS